MSKKKSKRSGKGVVQKRAVPNPAIANFGRTIGKSLTEAIMKQTHEKAEVVRAAGQAQIDLIEPKTLNVREPDEQHIVWTFEKQIVNGDNPIAYPLNESVRVPATAEWVWYPFTNELPRVVATREFSTGKYEIRLENYLSRTIRGNPLQAKCVAECLLSASDWSTAWATVLGRDISSPNWHDRERPAKG